MRIWICRAVNPTLTSEDTRQEGLRSVGEHESNELLREAPLVHPKSAHPQCVLLEFIQLQHGKWLPRGLFRDK